MWPPHFLMNFGNSSYSVTYRNICKDFVTNLSSNRDAKHYEFRTIKILTYQYLVPIVSLSRSIESTMHKKYFWGKLEPIDIKSQKHALNLPVSNLTAQ